MKKLRPKTQGIRKASGLLIAGAMLAALVLPSGVSAFEVLGCPGSIWGQITHEKNTISGSGIMGFVNQGVDWFNLPGDIVLNTFAEYRYRARTQNQKYYNSNGPAVGIILKKSVFQLGMDFYWEHFSELGETSKNREFFLTWFYTWDLKSPDNPKFLGIKLNGLPGSTWGVLTNDINGINGSGAQFFVNQGVNWTTLPGNIDLVTYAEYRYRARTRNQEYYDAQGPAVGVEFRKSYFTWGMDYYWERLPGLGQREDILQFYLTWYYDWDLKKVLKH